MVIAARDAEIRPGYKLTEVGVIPQDWEIKSLGEIASVGSGGTPDRLNPTYWRGDIPWITTTQINFNSIDDANEFITRKGLENSAARVYNPGTLLMAMYGQGKTRGKVAVLAISAAINQACVAIKVNKGISSTYIFYNLSAHYEEIRGLSNIGNQENLNTLIIKKILIPLPKEEKEQSTISTALSDVDALITSLDKLIAKKRDIKQATMQQLLTGKTRLEGFSGEWEVKKLGDVVETILGGGTPSRSNLEYWGGNIPWVTVKDFATFNPYSTQESITETGLQNSASHLIKKGTIIISTRMAIGKAVIYEVDVSINQDLKAFFLRKDIDTLFIFYWLEQNINVLENLGGGSTVKGISLSDLKNVSFLKPPTVTEQHAIATVLSDMDAEIVALEQKRDKVRALKQGMMQELLTGKTRLL